MNYISRHFKSKMAYSSYSDICLLYHSNPKFDICFSPSRKLFIAIHLNRPAREFCMEESHSYRVTVNNGGELNLVLSSKCC